MSHKTHSVQDDLAFLRALAEAGGGMSATGAFLYAAAGLIYGLECLGHYGQVTGAIPLDMLGGVLLSTLPTLIFLVLMAMVIAKERKQPSGGVANRAVKAAFQGAGLAILALILVFASAAARNHDFRYWLFHPAVVFVIQGAVWYVIFMLRKRPWMAVVSAGWLSFGVLLGMLVDRQDLYLLVAALGLFAWMMAPGCAMMRQARVAR